MPFSPESSLQVVLFKLLDVSWETEKADCSGQVVILEGSYYYFFLQLFFSFQLDSGRTMFQKVYGSKSKWNCKVRGTKIEDVKKRPAPVHLKQIKDDPLVAQDSSQLCSQFCTFVPPLDGAAVMLTALSRFPTCTSRWGQIEHKRFVFTLVGASVTGFHSQNVRTYLAADDQIKSLRGWAHNLTLTRRFCWKHLGTGNMKEKGT